MSASREMPDWATELLASVDMEQVREDLDRFGQEVDWYHEHLDAIRRDHSGKFVAVRGRRIVASHDEFRELLADLRSKGIERKCTFIEFVMPEGWSWVL